MNTDYHIIKNFSEKTSVLTKVFYNIIFFVAVTTIFRRKNFLTHDDYLKSERIIEKGDLVLVGTHKRISGLFLATIANHALLYIGNKELIHAVGDGVEKINLKELFTFYDTLLILRPIKLKEDRIKKIINYVESKINKPFDFVFSPDDKNFYCSELIYKAFQDSGFNTKLSIKKSPINPINFLNSNFKTIHFSNSLLKRGNNFILNHNIYKNKLFEYLINTNSARIQNTLQKTSTK